MYTWFALMYTKCTFIYSQCTLIVFESQKAKNSWTKNSSELKTSALHARKNRPSWRKSWPLRKCRRKLLNCRRKSDYRAICKKKYCSLPLFTVYWLLLFIQRENPISFKPKTCKTHCCVQIFFRWEVRSKLQPDWGIGLTAEIRLLVYRVRESNAFSVTVP